MDKKFLACLINTRDDKTGAHTETEGMGKDSNVFSFFVFLDSCVFQSCAFIFIEMSGNLLVLVDQHAAHERVRLENLVAGKTTTKIQSIVLMVKKRNVK